MESSALLVGLFAIISSSTQVHAQTVKMNCFNPALNVAFDVNKTRASSKPVQFNIVMDAAPGTIFVNGKNNGVCVATLDKDHVFTGSSYVIRPGGSYTEGSKDNPTWIEKTISISGTKTGNQEMTFNVVHNNASLRGNITVTFFVNYD